MPYEMHQMVKMWFPQVNDYRWGKVVAIDGWKVTIELESGIKVSFFKDCGSIFEKYNKLR